MRLANLQGDLADLQKRRNSVAGEIEAETKRLLDERASQLTKIESRHFEAMQLAVTTSQEVNNSVKLAQKALIEPEVRLKGLLAELDHVVARIASLEATGQQLQTINDNLVSTGVGLKAENQGLLEQIGPLSTKIVDLTAQYTDLQAQITADREAHINAAATYASSEQTWSDELNSLMAKKDELAIWIRDRTAEVNDALRAVGERQLVQDAQLQNIREREARIVQDNRQIAKNANLLNL